MSPPAALARKASTPGRHVYDVIVFGSQLGGVLAAGALAKRGLQVLLLAHDGLGSPYVHGDHAFEHAPFLTGALDKIPSLDALLNELGAATQVKRLSHAAGLQLLRPRCWFELHAEVGARAREAARALGETAAEKFLEALETASKTGAASEPFFQTRPDLPADGWFARWKLKRLLARTSGLDGDTTLSNASGEQALLRGLERFVTSAEAPLGRARALARLLPTPHTFPGGFEGLRALLADRVRELGVDVIDDQQIELLVLDGRTVAGVRLRKSDTVYKAGAVIAACDLMTWGPLIPEAKRRPVEALSPLVSSTRAVFTTCAVVPERALPRGLGTLALVEPSDAELGPVLLQVGPAKKQGQEDAATRVLSLSVQVPLALRQGGEPAVQALTSRVWSSVNDVLPFTRSHALVTSSPWVDAPRVVSGVAEPWPTFDLQPEAPLGVAGLTTRTPWPRLFIASRQVLPGLGLEGEALAAQRAIAAVETLLMKKKDPLRVGRPA